MVCSPFEKLISFLSLDVLGVFVRESRGLEIANLGNSKRQ